MLVGRLTCLAALLLAAPAACFSPALRAGVSRRAPAARMQGLDTPPSSADLFSPTSEMELAEQEAKLTALSEKWKKREEQMDYKETIRSGFGPSPERINGRVAMFFILVGLITEYYTGQSMPDQVYTMLQTLSILE